ncbi:alpha/beta fold hydrolase [Coralliovum pocilloporae]|uniref:alpha/beta fold hydrolase n=1 Tax=Coralliovum pocilloporae TaxID=3066369 RepID=UPI00330782C2
MTSEAALPPQDISFVTTEDGTQIAVAGMGRGPVILKAATWLSHVSRDPDSPVWQHWLAEFSRSHRFIRYDLRGCGLSDRSVDTISFEAWLSDLEAVAATLDEPFTLLGMSQGAALAIAYALRHPNKVERLVLIGAYAQGLLARITDGNEALEAETLLNLARLGWGRDVPAFNQVFTNLFIPDGTARQHKWWQDLERETSSPETAVETLKVLHRIDVLEEARKLSLPTLVFHARHDARIPFDEGRRLAAAMPRAEFVPLDSANHILLDHEPAWVMFCSRVRAFLAGPDTDTSTSNGTCIDDTFGLTRAETAVAELIARGLSNSDIADTLGKSEKTVRNQVSIIYDKTGVRSRSELIVSLLSA